jgi:trimethylamine--corrinoid protein Co-methyltransferase
MSSDQTRRGGRAARRKLRLQAPIVMAPALVLNVPLYEVLDVEGVELIHDASMAILEEVGIDFRDDDAAALWKAAGADVDGHRVRIDRAMLMELVAKAPETITMHGRNPDRTGDVGGRSLRLALRARRREQPALLDHRRSPRFP